MEFGISKWKTQHIENGKWIPSCETEYLNNEELSSMEKKETYKYLGFHQKTTTDQALVKTQPKQNYKSRLKTFLKTVLK